MGTCPARRADKSPGLSQDRSVPMCPDSSVAMSPDRSAAMSRDSSVRTFQDSSVRMFLRRSVPTSQESSVRTFPASSASRCPSRSVTPPSQLMESKRRKPLPQHESFSSSPPHPLPLLQASVDFENILVNSILCHFHHLSLSTIFMSALFKYNMRHSEIYKQIV